ncbi:MAG: glycosyltransferase [Oscillospiraceae bacterium]|nr:glycosyltransferase [Oscillospiraceae bacterium]
MNPFISIILPVYNASDYLAACLDCLLAQTMVDHIELLAIDDGSTDASPQILADYAQKHPRLQVFRQDNSGASATRNRGLAAATGDYVLFVDADDSIPLDACEKLYQAAQRSDADIVMGGLEVLENGQRYTVLLSQEDFVTRETATLLNLTRAVLHPRYFPYSGNNCPYRHRHIDTVWNRLIRRSLLSECGLAFDTSMITGEDQPFALQLFAHARAIAYVAQPLYCYRVLSGSLCHSIPPEWMKLMVEHMHKFRAITQALYPDGALEGAYWARVMHQYRMNLVSYVFGENGEEKKPLREKIRDIRALMRAEPYASAARHAPFAVLTGNEKALWLTLRLTGGRSVLAICAWYGVGHGIKRLIRWRNTQGKT